jgi:RNA polymerase sigma factor (TIGR02999 family)
MTLGPQSSDLPEGGDRLPPSLKRRELDDVFSLVYEELRRLASAVRRHDPGRTITSTALVHEAYLKLKASPHLANTSVEHFKAIAARAMRQVLVDAARRRIAHKRGGSGEAVFVALDDSAGAMGTCDAELIGLDIALERLAKLNVGEAASLLRVSESVVERDWRAAKAWLACELRPAAES